MISVKEVILQRLFSSMIYFFLYFNAVLVYNFNDSFWCFTGLY